MTFYVHTRANGFRRWVCVERVKTRQEGLDKIEALKQQDDPMWREAEYLVSESLHPLVSEGPTE